MRDRASDNCHLHSSLTSQGGSLHSVLRDRRPSAILTSIAGGDDGPAGLTESDIFLSAASGDLAERRVRGGADRRVEDAQEPNYE